MWHYMCLFRLITAVVGQGQDLSLPSQSEHVFSVKWDLLCGCAPLQGTKPRWFRFIPVFCSNSSLNHVGVHTHTHLVLMQLQSKWVWFMSNSAVSMITFSVIPWINFFLAKIKNLEDSEAAAAAQRAAATTSPAENRKTRWFWLLKSHII